jgi:hypothetical protein
MNNISKELKNIPFEKRLDALHKYAQECRLMEKSYFDLIEVQVKKGSSQSVNKLILEQAEQVAKNDFILWLNNAPECDNFKKAKEKVIGKFKDLKVLSLKELIIFFNLEFALSRVIFYFANIKTIDIDATLTKKDSQEIKEFAERIEKKIANRIVFKSGNDQSNFSNLLKKLTIENDDELNILMSQADRGNALRRILTIKLIRELYFIKKSTPNFLANIAILLTDMFFDSVDRKKEVLGWARKICLELDEEVALKR